MNYPKSKNNVQCIGPCYKPNTHILHPITLEYITNKTPFCPTNQWINPNNERIFLDKCSKPTSNKDMIDPSIDLLLPTISFNSEYFLKIYYKINSFNDAISWINNNKVGYETAKRILDCAWKGFASDIDVVSDNILETHVKIIKKHWIPDIYEKINMYLEIKNGNIRIGKKGETSKFKDQKMEYIINKFITVGILHKFITKYTKHYKNEWYTIESHIDNIKVEFIKYLTSKIKSTIN